MRIEQYRETETGLDHLGELTGIPGFVATLCGRTVKAKRQQLVHEITCPECKALANSGETR